MKHSYVSMFVLMMSVVVQAADADVTQISDACAQESNAQSNEKPICDSLNRFTVNCLKTTGGVTVGTFLSVVDGPVQIEPFTSGVLKSDVSGIISSINGTSGQILSVSPTTNAPAWTTLTSSNSSVLITVSSNFIDLQATGSGSGDVVGPVSSTQNAVVLFADTTGKVIQESLQNPSTGLPVTIDSATNMANINNLSITANFNMPITTNRGTAGVITVGNPEIPLIQALGPLRGPQGPTCIYVGGNAGNLTAVGSDNAGFGAFALENIGAGQDNSAVGFQALSNCVDGSNNIAIGSGAGRTIVNGSSGIYIGADAPSDESGVIRIGTGYHSALFIEAVNRVVSGTSPIVSRVVVTSFSSNQVGINSASPVCIDDSSNVSNVNALIFVGGDVSGDFSFGSLNMPPTAPTSGGFTPGVIAQQNSFLLHSGSPDGIDIYVGQAAGNVPLPTGSGLQNAGVGVNALGAIVSGMNNSALGYQSLTSLVSGSNNSAVGEASLINLLSGTDNTAVGYEALLNSTGSNNIALGSGAGRTITSGNSGVYIGADAPSNESSTIRIGTAGVHSSCFVSGVYGITTSSGTTQSVLIDINGQLGTASSSARYKKDIKTMESVAALLMKLRPVRFRYKIHDDQSVPEYGLIAEEVAHVAPDLVIYKDGNPESVKYHLLPALLIKALQEVIAKNEEQDAEIAAYKKELALLLKRIELLENHA